MKPSRTKFYTRFLLASMVSATFLFSANSQAAGGVGAAAGVSLNLINNILFSGSTLVTPKDSIFIEGDAFANYYNANVINYNYGFRGNLGYKLMGFSVYGLGGVQHAGFARNQAQYYKDKTAPIYGFGVGYDFPITDFGIRANSYYFSLDKKDGTKSNFNMVDVALVFVF